MISFAKLALVAAGSSVSAGNSTCVEPLQQVALRYDLMITQFGPGVTYNNKSIANFVAELKALNSDLVIGQYVDLMDSYNIDGDATYGPNKTKLDAENWWLRNAAGSQLTSSGSRLFTNPTDWVVEDSNGYTYATWLAVQRNNDLIDIGNLDFVMVDHNMTYAWDSAPAADWDLDTVNENRDDADVASKFRAGFSAFADKMREVNSSVFVIGNVNQETAEGGFNTLASNEQVGKFDGAYMENMTNQVSSLGWSTAYSKYRTLLSSVTDSSKVIYAWRAQISDYKSMRYGLATAMLGDAGYFSYEPSGNDNANASVRVWFDEFDLDLGDPVEDAPQSAWSNGVYKREYENGLVLVNPSGSQKTVTLPAGTWYTIRGCQDIQNNDGAQKTSITLDNGDGRILVKTAISPISSKRVSRYCPSMGIPINYRQHHSKRRN